MQPRVNTYTTSKSGPGPSNRAEVRHSHGLLQERKAAPLLPLLLCPAAHAGVNAFSNDWDPDYAQNITNARNFIIGDDSP